MAWRIKPFIPAFDDGSVRFLIVRDRIRRSGARETTILCNCDIPKVFTDEGVARVEAARLNKPGTP